MRTLVQRLRSAKLAALVVPTIAFVGCPSEQPVTLQCGAGTELKNGTCIAVTSPEDACGDGTVFDETTGDCEPTVRCGEGTVLDPESQNCVSEAECGPGTEPDLATGSCVPVASCGPGTVLDEATGECVNEANCGAGTELVDGECVAIAVCAPGSVLNMDTGLCESNTSCGPRQVIVDGQCMSPNEAVGLDADATESTPDVNDPAFGGTPEPLVLEAIGESTVFVGNIGRPADLGQNGVLTQDRDVWSFEGQAGQLLDIEVLGTGLPQPAFVVEGPRGFARTSALLSTNNAQREVLLPYDGTYTVTVVPSAWLSTGLPVGGTNAGYVGVISEIEKPAATTVVPSTDPAAPTEHTGNLRGLLDNFLLIDAPVGAAVSLIFDEPNAATPPSIMAFDAAGNLMTLVDLDLEEGAWVGTLVKDEEGTTVLVDWQSSTASDDAYSLHISEVPHIQGGTLNGPGATDGATILGESVAAYTITVDTARILNIDVENTFDPDLQIQSDEGTYSIIYDNDAFFFYAQPSTYTLFVFNDGTSEDVNAHLVYDAITPYDLGEVDPAAPQVTSVSGDLLTSDLIGPSQAWAVVRITGPGILALEASANLAVDNLEITVFDVGGNLLHGYWRAQSARPLYYVADQAETVIVQLDNNFDPVLEWELRATALPPAPVVDLEPNDASSTAVDLGALPAVGLGVIGADASDYYRFTLPEALQPNQHVEVQVDVLSTGQSGFTTNSVDVFLFDELDQPVASAFRYFSDYNNSVYLAPYETQSSLSFTIQVAERFVYSDQPYLIRVRVVDTPVKVEPNDTIAEANMADSLPAEWVATVTTEDADADEPDYFGFTLTEDVPAGEVIRVRMINMSSSNSSDIHLEAADGTVLASARGWDSQIVAPGLPAGTYYVRHVVPGFEVPYRLRIEQIPLPLEVEPNDTSDQGTAMGTLSAGSHLGVFGLVNSSDSDWFTFNLESPLGAEESIAVRAMNVLDTTTLDVELWDLSDSANPVMLGQFTDEEAVVFGASASTGPFGVRVGGNSSTSDSYHVRVEVSSGPAEREPNDLIEEAQDLGALVAGGRLYMRGTTSSSDDDYFTFTLDPSIEAGAGVWVSFDNLFDSTSMHVDLWDVTDPANPVQLSYEYDDFGTLVSAQAGGVYAIQVAGSSSTPDVYELIIEAGPAAELEPNDDGTSATALGALPASVYGVVSNTGVDVFSFTLDADLGAAQAVQIGFTNLNDGSSYDVTLRATDGTVIVTDDDDEMVLQSTPGLAAATYEIQVDGLDSTSSARVSDLYRLDVSIVDVTPIP